MSLSENGPVGDLPKEYELHFLHSPKSMYVFSESGLTNRVTVEGRVEREFQLRPVLNEEYRRLMKLRNEDSNKPKRSIQVVDNVQGGVKLGIIVPLNENELMKKKRKILPDQKRERLPRPELMDLLFSAFEKYTHWNLKGLVEYSQQPTIYLKEVLNEICVYLKRGPYKNMYQLKPEYRRGPTSTTSRPASVPMDYQGKMPVNQLSSKLSDEEMFPENEDPEEEFHQV